MDRQSCQGENRKQCMHQSRGDAALRQSQLQETDFRFDDWENHVGRWGWIGAHAVVCPGVTVYSHAVLGVNSVANRDLEAYSIYQGNPAIKIRERVIIG